MASRCILCLVERERSLYNFHSAGRPQQPAERSGDPAADAGRSDRATGQDATAVAQLLAAKSGTRSEQLSADQLRLFAQELECRASQSRDGSGERFQTTTTIFRRPGSGSGDEKQGRPRGRRPLPPHLKRERIEHDLTEEEKHCASCNQDLRPIGEETSERYEYIPAQLLVIEDVCKKYACACTVKTATKPPQPIEKSTAGASLLAQVIVSKIADHLPVHRQAKIFRRFGVEIADQTMCGWMRQSAELLDPLYERLKQFVLSSKVVGTDDTPVKVLDRSLARTTRKGRFWPYLGDRDHGAAVFDYTPTRERAGPEQVSERLSRIFAGRCLCGVRQLFHRSGARDGGGGLLGAHAAAFPPGAGHRSGAHGRGAGLHCAALCGGETGAAVGHRGRGFAPDCASRRRGRCSTQLHEYLLKIRDQVLPKSEAGQAVAYALKNWTALTRYCEDGDLSIDNNHTERSLRGIAVGRNNWMFVGSDRGGKTMAVLRSFVASCELVKVDPFAWFQDVLSRIGAHSIQQLDELLPHRWAAARL